jgi:hypothetical protein
LHDSRGKRTDGETQPTACRHTSEPGLQRKSTDGPQLSTKALQSVDKQDNCRNDGEK